MDQSASIIMGAALVFYSIGVWGERIQGRLKWWHFVFFVLGLICDTWGTGIMFEMVGGMSFDIHGITGATLSARAVTLAVRRVLAIDAVLREDRRASSDGAAAEGGE